MLLAKTFGMVLFQTALSRNNELVRTNRLFHFFAVANYKTYDMFLFEQSPLTERVSNNTRLRMRQFYFSGLLRRIDSHYGSKRRKCQITHDILKVRLIFVYCFRFHMSKFYMNRINFRTSLICVTLEVMARCSAVFAQLLSP